jgi:hypothetical protein
MDKREYYNVKIEMYINKKKLLKIENYNNNNNNKKTEDTSI